MRFRPLAFLPPLFRLDRPAGGAGPRAGRPRPRPQRIDLVATVMRPPGEARQPLVVINHGSPADSSQRPKMERPRYSASVVVVPVARLCRRLPLRRGYGETRRQLGRGLRPLRCAGLSQRRPARRRRYPGHHRLHAHGVYVAADRTIVVGQSAGGWATVALVEPQSGRRRRA